MPKTLTADRVTSVNGLQFIWKEGEIVGLVAVAEVNYGEVGLTHQVDIWPDLTPAQRDRAKELYDFIRQKIEAEFLG